MRLRLGKVTVADVLAAQPVTTNLLKFMRASLKMIGVSNLQRFIASMTQKLTLSDISDESKNYLDKAGITTACLRIKSKWTAGVYVFMPPNLGGFFMVRSYYPSECHADYFDFERIEALKPAIEACGISTLSQSPMLGFHKQMDNRI